jgi:hypothetical protein
MGRAQRCEPNDTGDDKDDRKDIQLMSEIPGGYAQQYAAYRWCTVGLAYMCSHGSDAAHREGTGTWQDESRAGHPYAILVEKNLVIS